MDATIAGVAVTQDGETVVLRFRDGAGRPFEIPLVASEIDKLISAASSAGAAVNQAKLAAGSKFQAVRMSPVERWTCQRLATGDDALLSLHATDGIEMHYRIPTIEAHRLADALKQLPVESSSPTRN